MAAGLAAALTGAAAALALADPGPLVRWGLPLVSTVSTLAASGTVGLLGLAAFLVPERTSTDRRVTATRYAARVASLWAVAALLEVVLTFASWRAPRWPAPTSCPSWCRSPGRSRRRGCC